MKEAQFAANKTGRFGLAMRFGGWLFLFFLVVGLFIAGVSAARIAAEKWVVAFGQDATGVVTDLTKETRGCGRRRHGHERTCTSYAVSVRFEADGVAYVSRHNVSAGYWNKLATGDRVGLRYMEKQPSFNQLEAGQQSWFLGLFLGSAFAVAGGFGVSRRFRTARRLIYLRSNGQCRQAQVTKQVKTLFEINDRALWKIEWLDEAGHAGVSCGQWRSGLPEVGATITIYVDPERRFPPAWEGDWR